MDYVYRRRALAQFFTRPGAVDAPTDDEKGLAADRLINAVYAEVRRRFPEHEALIDACTLQRYPMAGLWRHPVMGPLTIACMVDMGLLVRRPMPTAEDSPHGAR